MRILAMVTLFVFLYCTSLGQDNSVKKEKGKQKADKEAILTDVYAGNIPYKGNYCFTELILKHKLYADEGHFILHETPHEAVNTNNTMEAKGEWTVLRGDAKDENATVVEIDAPGNTQYFLRLKNGNLQKLDASLHEIKPVTKYLLKKQPK